MNYKFFILTLIIFGLEYKSLSKIYQFDQGKFRFPKILNILIVLIMLYYITGPDNTILSFISEFDGFKNRFQVESGLISPESNLISKIIHNCINFFMIIVVVNLLRRNEHYRKILIIILPVLTILMTLEVNREFFRIYEDKIGIHINIALGIAFIWTLLKFVVLYLIYDSKSFKKFMCFNNKKIRSLVLEKK